MLISFRQVQKLLTSLPRIPEKELMDIGETGAYLISPSIDYHLKVPYYDLGTSRLELFNLFHALSYNPHRGRNGASYGFSCSPS